MLFLLYAGVCYGSMHERQLLSDLLKDYNPAERPVMNDTQPVLVLVGMSVQAIVDLVSTIYIPDETFVAIDGRLWKSMDYHNIQSNSSSL